uniref:Uncharacterized protein n=1 Tax=Oryza punctata TaxID=4537 RepID=A0A0E0JZV9_ORYPU
MLHEASMGGLNDVSSPACGMRQKMDAFLAEVATEIPAAFLRALEVPFCASQASEPFSAEMHRTQAQNQQDNLKRTKETDRISSTVPKSIGP